MCRASDTFPYAANTYAQLLRIASVYVRFPGRGGLQGSPFPPESLTLVFLPRISEAELEINGTKVRPDMPAFVTLHRVRDDEGVAYWCRDKVRTGAGLRFEVYLEEEKVLKGIFRKQGDGQGWKMECRSTLERATAASDGDAAEVLVEIEGGWGNLRETVKMTARKSRRRGRKNGFRNGLEEIPEEIEGECIDGDDNRFSDEPCSCCDGQDGCEEADEVNTEGIEWAVDVGIWVLCLGVGFLVSKASSTKLTRRRRML